MAKTKISEWSATASSNTDIDSINIAEGCAPSGINDAIRELMSQVKDWYSGSTGDALAVAGGGTGATSASSARTNLGVGTGDSPSFTGLTLSGGTANGVAYLNGSKVLTTGSALTFDGTTFTTTGSGGIVATGANGVQVNNAGGGTFQSTTGFAFFQAPTASGNGFIFRDTSAGSYAEYMRLTSTGLGIGTSSPGAKLDVQGGQGGISNPANGTVNVVDTTTAAQGVGGQLVFKGQYQSGAYTQFAAITSYKESATVDGSQYGAALLFNTRTQGGNNTEKMRIDSSGNLGLGVTPSAWATKKAIQFGPSGSVASDAATTNFSSNAFYGSSTTYITTGYASGYYQNSGQHVWLTAPSGTAGSAITFTQAMTLDASGDFLVGQTAVQFENSNSTSFYKASGYWITNHASGTSTGTRYSGFAYNGTEIGSITQSGTTAVLYNTTSDQRLKENVADAEDAGSLVDSLQVRKFDWKADGSHQRYGFVAQELATVAPEAVHQPADPEEMMAVDYSKLVPMLVKEIQSLRVRVAQLEAKGA
jgi:hypothetical protein